MQKTDVQRDHASHAQKNPIAWWVAGPEVSSPNLAPQGRTVKDRDAAVHAGFCPTYDVHPHRKKEEVPSSFHTGMFQGPTNPPHHHMAHCEEFQGPNIRVNHNTYEYAVPFANHPCTGQSPSHTNTRPYQEANFQA